jgi:flagellar protein FliO/FliZ
LGGEKLKAQKSHLAALFAVAFIGAAFFGITFPVFAQTEALTVDAEAALPAVQETVFIDETAIPFDDPFPVQGIPAVSAPGFVVVRMVLVLALAALAIYGVVFFMKRLARPQENRDPHLKLLARVPLSSDSYAAVVSVGQKAWLVGGGGGGLNLIAEIDDAETLETLLLDDARRNAEAELRGFTDFRSLFQRLRGNKTSHAPSEGMSFTERLRKHRERLGGL